MILTTRQMLAHVEAQRALTRLRVTLEAARRNAQDPAACARVDAACDAERDAIARVQRWEDDPALAVIAAAERHMRPETE